MGTQLAERADVAVAQLAAAQDRERDAVLELHGFRVIRFTWPQLTDRAAATVRRLLA